MYGTAASSAIQVNKLNRPLHDDAAALEAVASNRLLGSYPSLRPHVATLKAAYAQYVAVNGDVSSVAPVALPVQAASYLRGHYSQPPLALSHITEMRRSSNTDTCPMCGSLHSCTLDHVMDKGDHPAFAIFSLNLVPACICNSKRLRPLVGPDAGERILHPYFDAVLSERIVAARFTDLGRVPKVETQVILSATNPCFAAACFHHDSITMRTGIHSYLQTRWSRLIERPSLAVLDLRNDPANRAELVSLIEAERDRTDVLRRSKNNWDSVFLGGLLDPIVVDWLEARLRSSGRRPNGPLL